MKRTIWILAIALVVVSASTASAQRRGGGFPGGGGNSKLFLLMNTQVQDELQMVDDQREKCRQVIDSMRDRMRDAFSGLQDVPQEDRREAMQSRIAEIQKELEADCDKVLLPHQRDRLEQIVLQQQIQRSGAAGALTSESVTEALGLTEAQKEQLAKAREEAEAQLEADIKKARDAAVEKVLSVLTKEQRDQWNMMQGKSFELERQPFGGGNRPFGGQNRRNRGGNQNDGNQQPDA